MNTQEKLCTWDENSSCASCINKNILHCKWDRSVLLLFNITAGSTVLIHIFGLIFVGLLSMAWWPLITFLVFLPVFFIFIEGMFLCSHCPYWSEDSGILHCLANHGIPKLFKYKPGPINGFERAIIFLCFVFFGLFSIGIQIWNVYNQYSVISETPASLLGTFGILGAAVLITITLFTILRKVFCSQCINFSCPFNSVPKKQVDEYLKRNSMMKEAWIKAGYEFLNQLD